MDFVKKKFSSPKIGKSNSASQPLVKNKSKESLANKSKESFKSVTSDKIDLKKKELIENAAKIRDKCPTLLTLGTLTFTAKIGSVEVSLSGDIIKIIIIHS